MTKPFACVVMIASIAACGTARAPVTSTPTASPGVVASVGIGRGPTRLAISPDGAVVYAASMEKLVAIRAATSTIEASVRIDPYTTGLAVTPDGGTVLLVAAQSSTLRLLPSRDLGGGSTISLPQDLYPGGYGRIAVSSDGRTALVGNEALWLAIVDLGAATARRSTLDMRPRDTVVVPDGRSAYVAGCKQYCTTGTIERIAIASGDVEQTFAVGPVPNHLALSPDGRRAYTTDLGGPSLSVVDLSGGAAVATLPVGAEPVALAVSPDGARVYVASHQSSTLTIARGDGRAVLATVPLVGSPRDLVLSPDGRRAWVSTSRPNAVLVLDTAQLLAGG
jgi:YVTN family beta-propeller protein